jgi:glutamate racemase
MSSPRILVFDSGLGGLSVHREIRALRPDASFIYLADTAAFPYGALSEEALVARVMRVLSAVIAEKKPDCVVIACNTASTLVLPHLRAAFPDLPFVGTVPAVKPACQGSRSGLISVLATPGTVKRDYTKRLIAEHGATCRVTLVGAPRLAELAEAFLRGEQVSDAALSAEIEPCFVDEEEGRTDAVVLGCTHYPLIRERLEALAPWSVTWIDPAPAIARRVVHFLGEAVTLVPLLDGEALITGEGHDTRLPSLFARFGLERFAVEEMPLG